MGWVIFAIPTIDGMSTPYLKVVGHVMEVTRISHIDRKPNALLLFLLCSLLNERKWMDIYITLNWESFSGIVDKRRCPQ